MRGPSRPSRSRCSSACGRWGRPVHDAAVPGADRLDGEGGHGRERAQLRDPAPAPDAADAAGAAGARQSRRERVDAPGRSRGRWHCRPGTSSCRATLRRSPLSRQRSARRTRSSSGRRSTTTACLLCPRTPSCGRRVRRMARRSGAGSPRSSGRAPAWWARLARRPSSARRSPSRTRTRCCSRRSSSGVPTRDSTSRAVSRTRPPAHSWRRSSALSAGGSSALSAAGRCSTARPTAGPGSANPDRADPAPPSALQSSAKGIS
jgi:hypothetical protein